MQVTKLLSITAAVLLAALVVQVGQRQSVPPPPRQSALWGIHPTSVEDAVHYADVVVRAQVIGIPQLATPPGPPTVNVPPQEVDHVTFQVIMFKWEAILRGKLAEEGDDIPVLRSLPVDANVPLSGDPSVEERWPILEDDPPYKEGQRYELFLMKGPTVQFDDGKQRIGYFVISPEGRYQILGENGLSPAALPGRSKFVDDLLQQEKPLEVLEQAIRDAK